MMYVPQQDPQFPAQVDQSILMPPDQFGQQMQQGYGAGQMGMMPLQYQATMLAELLSLKDVPEDIRKEFWYALVQDNTLTFLDENRKQMKLLNFDILKLDALFGMNYYDYDFETEARFNQVRHVFETKLDRAVGSTTANQKNERTILATQYQESRQVNDNDDSGGGFVGSMKRLFNRGR